MHIYEIVILVSHLQASSDVCSSEMLWKPFYPLGCSHSYINLQDTGAMKHGPHASNAHLDPLTQHDGPSSAAAPVPPPGSSTVPPASMSMGDPLADAGRASHLTA